MARTVQSTLPFMSAYTDHSQAVPSVAHRQNEEMKEPLCWAELRPNLHLEAGLTLERAAVASE